METVYCAVCEEQIGLDSDHVDIQAELKRVNDRDGFDHYTMHPDCWQELSTEWMEPA